MPFIAIAVFVSVVLGGGAVAATQTEQGQAMTEYATSLWTKAEVETEGSLDLSTDGSTFEDTRLADDHDADVTDPNTVGGDAYVGAELDVTVDGSLKVN